MREIAKESIFQLLPRNARFYLTANLKFETTMFRQFVCHLQLILNTTIVIIINIIIIINYYYYYYY